MHVLDVLSQQNQHLPSSAHDQKIKQQLHCKVMQASSAKRNTKPAVAVHEQSWCPAAIPVRTWLKAVRPQQAGRHASDVGREGGLRHAQMRLQAAQQAQQHTGNPPRVRLEEQC